MEFTAIQWNGGDAIIWYATSDPWSGVASGVWL